jgi:hypothetical protein
LGNNGGKKHTGGQKYVLGQKIDHNKGDNGEIFEKLLHAKTVVGLLKNVWQLTSSDVKARKAGSGETSG